VTVNPSNGKKERVFVDLQAVYPSPEVPGTELSFEEIWAANRGWLDRSWQRGEIGVGDSQSVKGGIPSPPHKEAAGIPVRHDIVALDENGRLPDQHRAGRRKKMTEVNETQISRLASHYMKMLSADPE
jgi:checkpoint serine/threonine-protein kinase